MFTTQVSLEVKLEGLNPQFWKQGNNLSLHVDLGNVVKSISKSTQKQENTAGAYIDNLLKVLWCVCMCACKKEHGNVHR